MVRSYLIITMVFVTIALRAHADTLVTTAHKYVVISDIDDTLSESRIKHGGRLLSYLGNALRSNDSFIGMPLLFNFLALNGAVDEYVTGTPQILSFLSRKFLESSGFPHTDNLIPRPSVFTDTEEFKVETISEIMRRHPADVKFILFGDNGEKDVYAYHRLQNMPEFQGRIHFVFIHKLYGDPLGVPLAEGQISYVTPAEVYLTLHKNRLIDLEQLRILLTHVHSALKSSFKSVRRRALPYFAHITEDDIQHLRDMGFETQDPIARELSEGISSAMVARKKVFSVWKAISVTCEFLHITKPAP